jgi:hypothetical protein
VRVFVLFVLVLAAAYAVVVFGGKRSEPTFLSPATTSGTVTVPAESTAQKMTSHY